MFRSLAWQQGLQSTYMEEVENGLPRKFKIVLTARRKPTFTTSNINNFFRQASRIVISGQAIRRRLHGRNLRAKTDATHPRVTVTAKQCALQTLLSTPIGSLKVEEFFFYATNYDFV